jgi:histidyl-tRNA synthetase
MQVERAKGTKEVNPEEKLVRNEILNVIVKNFELFGFQPLETPTLQKYDVLASKYAGGAEILKETFKLKDQGDRELALRYDLTVPLALYVALNPNVKLPFKRYEIGKVFRDGPISVERFREFWQCDADIVGSSSILADAEAVNLFDKVFKELSLGVTIKINNRKILDSIMAYAEIESEMFETVVLTIDKLEKVGVEGVSKELREKGLRDEAIEKIKKLILINGSNKDKIEKFKNLIGENEGLKEISELLSYSTGNIDFDLSLARGLSYYTGTIFEVKLSEPTLKTTIASGGRYDNIIGNFLGGDKKYPAVGISFGLDRIEKAMKIDKRTNTKVYVVPIKQTEKALEIINNLRDNGINSDMDIVGRGVSKNLDFANSYGIPYVIIIGENEVKENKFTLRNMKSGEEKKLSLNDIIKILKEEHK